MFRSVFSGKLLSSGPQELGAWRTFMEFTPSFRRKYTRLPRGTQDQPWITRYTDSFLLLPLNLVHVLWCQSSCVTLSRPLTSLGPACKWGWWFWFLVERHFGCSPGQRHRPFLAPTPVQLGQRGLRQPFLLQLGLPRLSKEQEADVFSTLTRCRQ